MDEDPEDDYTTGHGSHSPVSISADERQQREQQQQQRRESMRENESDKISPPISIQNPPPNSDHTKVEPFCWLCEYQGNRTTNEVIRFIMEGIPHMALETLVKQSKYLLDRVDVGSNCSTAQIKRHVTLHMLHPRVKLALQLQEMAKLQQEIIKCCVVDDAESGGKTVNPQAMRVYLTLCSQVAGVYKMGEEKLTFNQASLDK
jgi:hypothetical protein